MKLDVLRKKLIINYVVKRGQNLFHVDLWVLMQEKILQIIIRSIQDYYLNTISILTLILPYLI